MAGSDDTRLPSEQYADSSNLKARLSLHERFSTNGYGWHRWVFDRVLRWGRRDILEAGCGPATLWRVNRDRIPGGWHVTLSDFSVGMVSEARDALDEGRRTARFAAVEVTAIPFATSSFDSVIANHMLYHVADRRAALREIARVLRPDGCLIATTNGSRHLAELDAMARRHGFEMEMLSSAPFALDNAEPQLREVFEEVVCERYEDSLRVTEAEALVEYVVSTCNRGKVDAAAAAALRVEAADAIRGDGFIHITKDAGLLRATRRR